MIIIKIKIPENEIIYKLSRFTLLHGYKLFIVHLFFMRIFNAFSVCLGRDRMEIQLPMQSVSITTNVVSSNATQAIQHYVIKLVSDLQQVGCFLRVLQFPPPIKLTATI
jgi:hypothetical protein